MLEFDLSKIEDPRVAEAIQRIREQLRDQPFLRGQWKFFEITLGTVTNRKYPHNLGFKPTDIIQTSKTGAGAITWNYTLFDSTYLDITTTGACVVRAFIGRYEQDGRV